MDYHHIFSKAWKISWNNKYLWLLGFCAGLTLGRIEEANFSDSMIRGGTWLIGNIGDLLGTESRLAFTLFFISILFLVIGTFARIGLILKVAELEEKYGESISHIGKIFRTASPYVLPILVMQLLIWSPIIILSIPYQLMSQSLVTGIFSNIYDFSADASVSNFGYLGLSAVVSCGLTILTIITSLVDAFAYRSLILHKTSLKESIFSSIHFLKENSVHVLILTLIFGIAIKVIGQLLSVIFIPFQYLTSDAPTIPIRLISSIVTALLVSIWITFQSAVFTSVFNTLSPKNTLVSLKDNNL